MTDLVLIKRMDLFLLRLAAGMWLKEHRVDPNASAVKEAYERAIAIEDSLRK